MGIQLNPRTIFRKFVDDTKITHKFIISVLFIVAFPLLFVNSLYYYKLQQGVESEMGLSYRQVVNQYVSNINYKLSIYTNILDNITLNNLVQEVFAAQDEIDGEQLIDLSRKFSKEIDSMLFVRNSSEIRNIMLYAFNENFPNDGRHISNVGHIQDEKWYKEIVDRKTYDGCFFMVTEGTKTRIITLVRPIVDLMGSNTYKKMGIARIDLTGDSFFKVSEKQAEISGNTFFVFAKSGDLIYQSSKNSDSDIIQIRKVLQENGNTDQESDRKNIRIAGREQMLIIRKVDNYGWTVAFLFERNKIDDKIGGTRFFIFATLFSTILLLIGLTLLFSNFFSRRIKRLTHKMKTVADGNLEIVETIRGKDEVGMIDDSFNNMVHRLKELISENFLQSLEKKEAELNALQVQINPHFLYNTLESINAIASLHGCSEVCTISQTLGDMFRYSINIGRGEFVRLKDEIRHVENYLSIQKIRFGDMFEVYFDIPKNLQKCRVLKFILQPVVENTLYHGFKNKAGRGTLEISAFGDQGMLVVKVKDDGDGIPEERLKHLMQYLNERLGTEIGSNMKSIGLKNVNSRIKIACGEGYGLFITSKEKIGTQVLIKLPLMGYMEEDENV